MIYEAFNVPVFSLVPPSTRRLLDLGCGSGTLSKRIKQTIPCEIVGVTYSQVEADLAKSNLDQVVVRDLNLFEPSELGRFDCVVCSHVLEHLYTPDALLRRLHCSLEPQAMVIVALPNILHWRQRLRFLTGRFRYTEGGVMDRTHFRFYDWTTARGLMEENGYRILSAQAQGTFPLSRFLFGFGRWLNRASTQWFPSLFGVQFVMACQAMEAPVEDKTQF